MGLIFTTPQQGFIHKHATWPLKTCYAMFYFFCFFQFQFNINWRSVLLMLCDVCHYFDIKQESHQSTRGILCESEQFAEMDHWIMLSKNSAERNNLVQ